MMCCFDCNFLNSALNIPGSMIRRNRALVRKFIAAEAGQPFFIALISNSVGAKTAWALFDMKRL